MAYRISHLKKLPLPSPQFSVKYRTFDLPCLQTDDYTMVLTYRGIPSGHRHGPFNPVVMIQALDYDRASLSRAETSIEEPTVKIQKIGLKEELSIRFQSTAFEATADRFRIYALVEDLDDIDGVDAELDPSGLISKRAYFERQLDDEIHYGVWDRLLNEGRTRQDLWVELQEKYLFKYKEFFRIECDWGGSGIWAIPFPGSFGTGANYGYDNFDLPKKLVRRFGKWTEYYQSMEPGVDFEKQGFKFDWFDKEGEFLASALAGHVDENAYVEYHPFVQARSSKKRPER